MMQKMKDKQVYSLQFTDKQFLQYTQYSLPHFYVHWFTSLYTLLQWVYSEKKLFNKSYHVVKVFSVFKNSFQEMLMMIYLDGVRWLQFYLHCSDINHG